MAEQQLYDIFKTAEISLANHPRLIQRLINVYNQYPFEEFFKGFVHCLEIIFHYPIVKSRKKCVKSLDFAAQFIANMMKQAENDSIDEDFETPEFICKIIMQALKYNDLVQESLRYYSCQFINLVLKHLGENAQLDDDLYLAIQNSMLETINDRLPNIRLQAITCLLRLQDPLNNDCPVIKAYINCLADPNVAVRSASIKTIAVTSVTIPKIVKCLYDQNHVVRSEATLKCAHINPIYFRIQDRQKVLQKLFTEDNKVVKKCFHEVLFPKWLGEYKNDILKFLKSIKLDGDDSDIDTVDSLSKNILEVYFTSFPISDIIAGLNLSENKLIPYEKLSMEVVAYWNTLITYLKNNDLDDYLDDLQPELLHFCNYIDKFIANSLDELKNKKMDDWQMLEFQYKLNILMVMAGQNDLADEVGRKALHSLILNILQHNKLHMKTLYTVINILSKLSNTPQDFSLEICTLISDIREPFIEEEEMVPDEQPRNSLDNNFNLARMKLKLDVLIEEREEAKNEENFQLAAEKHEEIKRLSKEVSDMEYVPTAVKETVKVRKLQDDSETITQYLDILIVALQIVKKLDDNLYTCIKEVLHPLMDYATNQVCLRVFKCNCLLSLLDKEYAFDNIKMIATPIVMFHYMTNYDLNILSASMGAISDLIVLYGTSLLGNGSDTTIQKKNVRRLYNQGEFNFENLDMEDYSSEEVMNIIIEIMDDENVILSEVAVNAVARLLMAGALVTPSLISRVLLKYLNPMMVKNNPKLQQMLISGLLYFANKYTNAIDVIAKAVFPTLNMIMNAPKTNPLSEIDLDNTIDFLAGLTNNSGKDTVVNAHQDLYLELCTKLVKYPNDYRSGVWIKMLLVLQLPTDDKIVLNEIKQRLEIIIEEITDKTLIQKLKKHLSCFIEYLNTSHGMSTITEVTEETIGGDQISLAAKKVEVSGKQQPDGGEKTNIEEVSSDHEIVESSEAKRSKLQSSDDDTQSSAFVVPGRSICNELVVLQNITVKKTDQRLKSDDESSEMAKENKTGQDQAKSKERSNISPENKSVISDTDVSSINEEDTSKGTVEVNGSTSIAEDSATEKEDNQNGNNKRQNGKVSTRIRKKPKRFDISYEENDENNKNVELGRRSKRINNDVSVLRVNGKKTKAKGKQEQKTSKVSAGSKKSTKQNAKTSLGMISKENDKTTLNESVSVKRKKQRGNVQSISFEDSEETILYTILEPSEFNYSNLEDSSSSRRTKSIVSETSSDDEKPARKSVRLSKKKNGSV